MDNAALLAHLRALLERQPDWNVLDIGREHKQWLAQARAMLKRWDPILAVVKIETAVPQLGRELYHDSAVEEILQTLENAIADLELEMPPESQAAFGAGDVYDIFRELNKVIGSAEVSVFIIDPYLDPTVFDLYLEGAPAGVNVRLLCNRHAGPVSAAAQRFGQQHGAGVEVRQTNDAHDRVIFLDDAACFVLGQSLKDAGKAKPTYIAALPPDVAIQKLRIYNEVWNAATVV